MVQLVITAVGPDRPGIVGELTGHLHTEGANILDSRMVNLRGQFALVMLFECANGAKEGLSARVAQVGKAMGLTVALAEQGGPPSAIEGLPFRLKTYSMDQPGIVHRVSNLLRTHNVNIEELTTRQESAAFAGSPLFTMEMRITVPRSVPVRKLREQLEALCDSLNCDVDLEGA